ncbi:unnamed protein product, partial [Ectocarpus sp. 6 AP-2014]
VLSHTRRTHPTTAMALPFMTPSPGINYNFVAGSYLLCSLILVVLLALDKFLHVEAVEGSWVVFAPFFPCLAWALVIRSKWLATGGGSSSSSSSSNNHVKDD